jgi:hypothetical protein
MHRNIATLAALLGAGALAACQERGTGTDLLAAATSTSPLSVSRSFEQMVSATATSTVTGCDNSPGPYITIEGGMRLGGLGTRMTFTNNQKGTHTYTDEAHVDVTVVPADGNNITIPKQPVLGGVGGNPYHLDSARGRERPRGDGRGLPRTLRAGAQEGRRHVLRQRRARTGHDRGGGLSEQPGPLHHNGR